MSEQIQANLLFNFLKALNHYFKLPSAEKGILKIHTKNLESSGDISLPLNIKEWHNFIVGEDGEYFHELPDFNDSYLENLIETSKAWYLNLHKANIKKDRINIYLERHFSFKKTIEECLLMKQNYGASYRYPGIEANIIISGNTHHEINDADLTYLRMIILQSIIKNLSEFQLSSNGTNKVISITLSNQRLDSHKILLCGSVINQEGIKDTSTSAGNLYKKRSTDMRLMAEHKYGIRTKSSESWNEYFNKLGEAAVTFEMLQNKPHKNLKISLHDLNSANKGASFVFYNCARLSALLKTFEKKVDDQVYLKLSSLDQTDFSLLNQPEEWELLYVYVMQYPHLIKSCVRDIEKGIANPQYLVSFLSNMSSIFSVYYRRVRILVTSKPHLIPTIHARIYLLQAVQQVFHNSLRLMNIDPIREM